MSTFNYNNTITLDNTKILEWLDTSNNSIPVLQLNASNNVFLTAKPGNDLYINNSSTSSLFLNHSGGKNVIIKSKLGINLSSDVNINANLTLANNSYIGTDTSSTGGYLGLASSNALDNSVGSRMIFYNNQASGSVSMYAGNNGSGSIKIHTGNDLLRLEVSSSGNLYASPDGSTIMLHVANDFTWISNNVSILSTTQSIGVNSGGSLDVKGGASIVKNLYVGGEISSSSDYRLKKDIEYINESLLDKISSIKPIKYRHICDTATDKLKYGFVAQDFVTHFPELLKQYDSESYYALNYEKITVVLMKCVQELYGLLNKNSTD